MDFKASILSRTALAFTLLTPLVANAADSASGELLGSDGAKHGSVKVTATASGVLLRVQASGLTPGWHGIHFHEKGDCSAPSFTSAGSHVHAENPIVHGFFQPKANDAGDLPNMFVSPDGSATVELYSNLVTLVKSGDKPALLDADGASLVIHAQPDDYKSQPIGGAGARVACAVLK